MNCYVAHILITGTVKLSALLEAYPPTGKKKTKNKNKKRRQKEKKKL